MSTYSCTHCDQTFEHTGGKLRCPRCLRTNGLLPKDDPTPPRRPPRMNLRRGLMALVALALASGLGAGGYFLYLDRTALPRPGELGMLSSRLLWRTLVARGVPEEVASVDPLSAGPVVKQLVQGVTDGDRVKRADRVVGLLSARVKALKPELAGPEPAGAVPLLPEELARMLVGTTVTGRRITSFELASLLLAALRTVGVPSVLAMTTEVKAPTKSADPTGVLGRFLVAVYADDRLGAKPRRVLDPLRALSLPSWAGPSQDPSMKALSESFTLLDDASAAAHRLALTALAVVDKDLARAYKLSNFALAASMPSPSVTLCRAMVLARSGGLADAVAAARKALGQSPDAARRIALAKLLLRTGQIAEVKPLLDEARKQDPGFWPAMLMQAMLMLASDGAKARALLDEALALAPDEPEVLLLSGVILLDENRPAEAVAPLKRALAGRSDPQAQLLLYQALVGAGRREEATLLRRQILAASTKREDMSRALDALDRSLSRAAAPDEVEGPQGGQGPDKGSEADPEPGVKTE